eukprot:s327_g15.t1
MCIPVLNNHGKLNWAAQNALVQACGHGSKVIANAVLELSWITRRGVDVKFFVLPRLGGGGDCARTLVESSAGGYEPPFPVTGPTRIPGCRVVYCRGSLKPKWDVLRCDALA